LQSNVHRSVFAQAWNDEIPSRERTVRYRHDPNRFPPSRDNDWQVIFNAVVHSKLIHCVVREFWSRVVLPLHDGDLLYGLVKDTQLADVVDIFVATMTPPVSPQLAKPDRLKWLKRSGI
jgi:hypothetical protein